jgi:N-acetylglutamate synthase-like GNAT family acetyltransferase
MEIRIRNAEIKDAASIAELSNQLGYEADSASIEKRLSEMLGRTDNCVLVATENTHTIGWIHGFYTLRVESDSFVEIGGLVVDEKNRHKGIGKLLVAAIIHWTESINCSHIRVRSSNKRIESHKFYEKIGFIHIKEQKIFDMVLK